MSTAFESFNIHISDDEAVAIIQSFDIISDGRVTFQEFRWIMHQIVLEGKLFVIDRKITRMDYDWYFE